MILDKTKEIISKELGIDIEEIKPESDLKQDLGVDSIDLFDIYDEIEKAFNVDIRSEALENIKTVEDIVKYISNYKK